MGGRSSRRPARRPTPQRSFASSLRPSQTGRLLSHYHVPTSGTIALALPRPDQCDDCIGDIAIAPIQARKRHGALSDSTTCERPSPGPPHALSGRLGTVRLARRATPASPGECGTVGHGYSLLEEHERWAGLLVRLLLAPKCSGPRLSGRPLRPARSLSPESALVYTASVGSRLAATAGSGGQQIVRRAGGEVLPLGAIAAHGSRPQRRRSQTTGRRSGSPANARLPSSHSRLKPDLAA